MTLFVCTGNAGKLEEFRACLAPRPVVGIRELQDAYGVAFVEPEENAPLFLANGLTKLFSALAFVSACAERRGVQPGDVASRVLVDDSGLCVPALGFEPGVHSSTFGGLPRDDGKNRRALASCLAKGSLARTPAFFVCYLISAEVDAFGTVRSPHSVDENSILRRIEREEHMPLAERAQREGRACGARAETRALGELLPAFADLAAIDLAFGYCTGNVTPEEQALIPGAGHGYDAQFFSLSHPTHSFASISLAEKNAVSHRAQALAAFEKHIQSF